MYDEGTEGYRDCNDEADDWDEIKKTLPGGESPKWCGARFDPEGLLATVPTVRRTTHSWSLSFFFMAGVGGSAHPLPRHLHLQLHPDRTFSVF